MVTYCYEPTAHPDFPEIYDPRIALDHGGWLVTNGFGLAWRADYPQLLERMHAMNFHTLALTLHGLREHHDWFVCRKGAFDDILLATRRAREAGFRTCWQVYADRLGLDDLPGLVELARQECQEELTFIGIPSHYLSKRLWQYEKYRPSLKDLEDQKPARFLLDPEKNMLANAKTLTAAAWLEKWKQLPQGDDFRNPFEPPTWPPQTSFDGLCLYIHRDRKVYFDPSCAEAICLGELSEGRDVLLGRLKMIQPPEFVHIDPETVELSTEEKDKLHPAGFSVRNLAMAKAYHAK
jgi:hypothetical protein